MRFDSDSSQRDDLMAAQYLRWEMRIRAAAECAIHERYSRKTSLTLIRVRESRAALDRLHALASQIEFRFDDAHEPVESPLADREGAGQVEP